MDELSFMRLAIELSVQAVEEGLGGPFGAVLVRDGEVVGRGQNRVVADRDPTAHAEIVAIRNAARTIGSFHLTGCTLYTSCEPCPMCLGAACWARVERIVHGATREDAAAIGFDDERFYRELALPPGERSIPMESVLREEALAAGRLWAEKADRTRY